MASVFYQVVFNRIEKQDVVTFKMMNGIETEPSTVEKIDQGVVFLNHLSSPVYKGVILFDQIESMIIKAASVDEYKKMLNKNGGLSEIVK